MKILLFVIVSTLIGISSSSPIEPDSNLRVVRQLNNGDPGAVAPAAASPSENNVSPLEEVQAIISKYKNMFGYVENIEDVYPADLVLVESTESRKKRDVNPINLEIIGEFIQELEDVVEPYLSEVNPRRRRFRYNPVIRG